MQNLLIVCGGMSAEHEISIISARNVIQALDRSVFYPILVIVSRSGTWYLQNDLSILDKITAFDDNASVANVSTLITIQNQVFLITLDNNRACQKLTKIDIAFPLIHGPIGEDGSLQGMFEVMNLPYVGSHVISSAICMDKDFFKRILMYAGIPVAPFISYSREMMHNIEYRSYYSYEAASKKLDSQVLFIKPAIMGSSIGIYKVKSVNEYKIAIDRAFQYSDKIMIEKFMEGREIECSVLGNSNSSSSAIVADCLGEVKYNSTRHDFYSYEAKYFDEKGAELIMPANIDKKVADRIKELAIKAYIATECKGFARVDFFVSKANEVYINELNTLPGFTSISMYPKLWELSGLKYKDLITKLIACGFAIHQEKQKLSLKP